MVRNLPYPSIFSTLHSVSNLIQATYTFRIATKKSYYTNIFVLLHATIWFKSGFTFSFLKKISVTTGNGIPAEISRFFGNFDRKEFSNSKFRNFGIPAGFSVHLAGFSVLFTEKWWKQLENDGEIMYLWKEIENFGEFALIMSIFIDYNTQYIRNSSTQWEIRKRNT